MSVDNIERTCKICKKKFDVYSSYVKRGNGVYCSRECKDNAQSVRMKAEPPEKHPRWMGGPVEKKCVNCEKKTMVKRHLVNKPSFCSKSCANSYNVKQRKPTGSILKCKVCEKEFYRVPSAINRKDKKPNFCSHRCRAIHSVRNQKKNDTNIERILEKWLFENMIKFKKQEIINGIALVDFLVEPNICLFADGDYWHSIPKRKEIDKEQTRELTQAGYSVVRILGSKLLKEEYPNEIL